MDESFFKKARRMLARDEEEREFPYDDKTSKTIKSMPGTGGKITIGIGRNLCDVPLSDAVTSLMFAEDLQTAERTCIAVFGDRLWGRWSENRRLGWTNFAFNLGAAKMKGFVNALAHAVVENWILVERHLKDSAWYRQVGPKYPGHDNRADRVIAMICREEFPYGA